MPLTRAALDAWQVAPGTAVQVDLPRTPPTAALCDALVAKGVDLVDEAAVVIGAELGESPLYRAIYRETGVGQAAVMAFVDITNLQLAGRPVTVVGYGPEGAGTAAHVAAFGGRVTVQTDDPVARVLARNKGYTVGTAAGAEVVFATADLDVEALRDEALVCTVTDVDLGVLATAPRTNVRAHVDAVAFGDRRIHLIAGGAPVHLNAANGVPIAVADLAHALHILSCASGGWTPEIDAQVAKWKDSLTP